MSSDTALDRAAARAFSTYVTAYGNPGSLLLTFADLPSKRQDLWRQIVQRAAYDLIPTWRDQPERCTTCDYPAGEPEPVRCPDCGH